MSGLRIAILCDRERLEPWRLRCIERLIATEAVEVVALLVAPDPRRPGGRRARALQRLCARLVDARAGEGIGRAGVAQAVPRIEVSMEPGPSRQRVIAEADLDRVRALAPDVVLSIGIDPPSGSILSVPRHGLWTFDFDRHWTERAGLGEVWRILRGEPVTEVSLLRLVSAERAALLKRGWFRGDDRAPLARLSRIRGEAARWPASICAALHPGESVDGATVAMGPAGHPVPSVPDLATLVAAVLRSRLAFAYGRLFRHPQWNIGIIDKPIQAFLNESRQLDVNWFPLRGRRGFLADPFGVLHDDGAAILCEHFDYRRAHGTICAIDVDGRGRFASEPRPVLELPGHFSYPCLVEDDGTLYCAPEALPTREVGLFRVGSSTEGWSRAGTLVRDVAAVDPTLFRHDGRWWLACSDGDAGPDELLLLWHAPALEGPWTQHRANPVKCDVRSSRPAGTPFEHDGVLYRPAQDCSRGYGGRVVINRVTRLTPDEFAEEPVAAIAPAADCRYPAGRHTLSALGDRTLVDGHRFTFVGVALLHFFRLWGRDLVLGVSRIRRCTARSDPQVRSMLEPARGGPS